MNLNEFMEKFASEIGGQYSEYDSDKSVIIVPLDQNRFQAVLGNVRRNGEAERLAFEFTSKVCEYNEKIDLKELLKRNNSFFYAKFIIIDDIIKVEASTFLDTSSEEQMKEMVVEVAKAADEWEYKLTGLDVN
ncbi:MAG: hypothetical protein ACNS62_12360 [Candidatus Cyclobacteriaceae bacterium M3_2C_046]